MTFVCLGGSQRRIPAPHDDDFSARAIAGYKRRRALREDLICVHAGAREEVNTMVSNLELIDSYMPRK